MEAKTQKEREADQMETMVSRPRALRVVMVLETVNGLFGLLWPIFLPLFPLSTTHPSVTTRPMAMILVIAFLSIFHLIVPGGLWKRQQWAFRLGFIITVFTLGIDLFLLLALLWQTTFDGGAVFALLLTCVILCCFLRPEVIGTVIAWKR